MKCNLRAVIGVISLAVLFFGVIGHSTEALAGKKVKNSSKTSVNNNSNTNVNVNSNRSTNVNVNTNRNVNINVDNDRNHHHPIATAAAVTAAVVVTSAVVGSVVRTIPPSCVPVQIGNAIYQQCGSTWYQPQYAGSSVQYIVINPPR